MSPEDEKGERASVCAYILSLSLCVSLPHTQRLTAFDLLLGVYSKAGEKKEKTRETEREREEKNGAIAIFQM
jgi:hypothetical protein